MKNLLTARKNLLACSVFGLTAIAAAAQSLGPVRGATVLGRPVELSVPVTFDSAKAAGECVATQLFYGDARIDASQVKSQLRDTPGGALLTVASKAPVNEPVVTLEVRVGCQNSATRRYTLLPEPARRDEPLVAQVEPSAPVMQTAVAGAAAATLARMPKLVVQRVREAIAAVKPAPRAHRSAASQLTQRLGDATSKDRLKMDVAPAAADAPTLLRVSTLMSAPGSDAAHRAAMAALWQALNAQPQQVQNNIQLLHAMQSEIGLMRSSLARSNAELAGMRELAAQSSRTNSALLAAAAAMLLLLAGGAAWSKHRDRLRAAMPAKWFEFRTAEAQDALHEETLDAVPQQPLPVVSDPAEDDTRPRASAAATSLPSAPVEAAAATAAPDPAPVAAGAPAVHAARIDSLVSLLQEVEFLESLGLWADAVDTLKDYLKDAKSPPPVAHCELLRLCWAHDDEVGVAAARAHWLYVFGSQAPAKSDVIATPGLEAHTELAARVAAAWPSKTLLEMIDRLVFAKPQSGPRLSLQAWRDLLWLYSMAQAILAEEGAGAAGEAPWLEAGSVAGQVEVPSRGAVDLDLNDQPDHASIVLQEEAIAWARRQQGSHDVRAPLEADGTRPGAESKKNVVVPLLTSRVEKKRDFTTYEEMWDVVSSAEGKFAYQQG